MKIRITRFVYTILPAVCLILALTLAPVNQTFAYSFTGDEQCYFYIDYRWGGSITSFHKSAFQQALTDWNNSQGVRRFVGGTSSAPGALDSYSDNDNAYGYSLWYSDFRGCITSWVSKLNSYYDSTFTPARSSANHELGHVLGLDHTNNWAVMKPGRDRNVIYTPQTDDINGVNALYR